MSSHSVQFYFDYNSPYSFMASHRIEAVCERANADILWMPMVLGGLFQENGITPPHLIENRREYMTRDLKDLSAHHGIPYKERTVFLFKPIVSLRATLAVPQGPERGKAVHALYRGAFEEDRDLGDPEIVARLLDEAGFDGKALVERTQQQAIKDELKSITDNAIALGFFGAPTFLVDQKKWFWGQDRLDLMESYLKSS